AQARAGRAVARPACPVLVIASEGDDEVPAAASAALAARWGADLLRVPGSHVGPLLGRQAAGIAAQAVDWMNADRRTGPEGGRVQGGLQAGGGCCAGVLRWPSFFAGPVDLQAGLLSLAPSHRVRKGPAAVRLPF